MLTNKVCYRQRKSEVDSANMLSSTFEEKEYAMANSKRLFAEVLLPTLATTLMGVAFLTWGCDAYNLKPTLTILAEDIPTAHAIKSLVEEEQGKGNLSYRAKFVLEPYGKMVQKANQDLAAGTGVYDIILQYNTALATYVPKGWVYTLSEVRQLFPDQLIAGRFPFEDDLFRASWEEVGWYRKDEPGGMTDVPVAIPFSANTMFLAYNRELMNDSENKDRFRQTYNRELAPPKTWAEFYDIAEFFTRPEEGTWGLVLQGAPYFIYYEWSNIAFSMGGGVMQKRRGWQSDEQTQLTISSPETVAATRYYRSLRRFDASEDFFSYDAVAQRERFSRGDVALAIMWSDVAWDLVASGLFTEHQPYGFAPIPGDVSMLAGGSYYINKKSRHPREAMTLILDQLDPAKQAKLMRHGLCSPVEAVYDVPSVRQNVPYADALRESLERGVYMLEAGPDADAIIESLSDSLQNLFRSPDLDVGDVLRNTEGEVAVQRRRIYEHLADER